MKIREIWNLRYLGKKGKILDTGKDERIGKVHEIKKIGNIGRIGKNVNFVILRYKQIWKSKDYTEYMENFESKYR